MKCVFLAAGEGKRMHPLTYTRPKVMLPVANKPLMEWNLLNAIDSDITDFVFVVGYKSEMVRKHFGDGKKWDVSINYVNQGKAMGTSHAIGCVERFVDEFIVACGDTIFGKSVFKKFVENEMCMGLTKVDKPDEYGVVEIEEDRVVKIFEKMDKPFNNVVNAGIYRFDKNIFDFIKNTKKSQRGEYEITDTINMMSKNNFFKGIVLDEWRDVVYPWDFLGANEEILSKLDPKNEGIIEENVTLKENVSIGENSRILSGSYIEGPVIIGSNCKIGPNCYIRPFSSIGDGCHVGAASEIKNSILMDNSNAPHHNYVGDSIVGEGCNLGSGTKIANLRLDKKNIKVVLNGKKIDTGRRKLGVIMGDNVQTGVNSVVEPGCTIGNDVFIGPGSKVKGEIKFKSRIL